MSAEIINLTDGILTVRFSGRLTQPELAALQQQTAGILEQHSKLRILVVAENFRGWERTGEWDDVSFQAKHDHQIERMAIVCDERWESLALLFASKGFRKFPIEYFSPASLERARAWVAENERSIPSQRKSS